MPAKYQDFLAVEVINEGNIVSYRSLSRAMKVHSNTAKEMLYDFYTTQNDRKPGSLHASYFIAGVKKAEPSATNGVHTQDGEDSLMAGDSFMSSSMPEQEENTPVPIPITSITVVKEEDLEAVKALYTTIDSIHIYSLEPSTFKDIQLLSNCNARVASGYATEDPLEIWKQYGTIQNPSVKRRTGRRAPPPPPPAQVSKTSTKVAAKPDTNAGAAPKTTAKPAAKTPSLKKENSNLFASFAKSKTVTKKDDSQSSAAASIAAESNAEDGEDAPVAGLFKLMALETMKDVSDDEEDDAFALDASEEAKAKAEANRKAKSEREEQLRKMMEGDDDDAMEDAPAETTADTPEPPPEDTSEAQDAEPEQEPQVTVSDGRRRGKRKVMKKKTTKDSEGYLVTKEEAVWESFSEDEPAPTKPKMPVVAVGAAAKNKKSASGKPGQKNINSFFSKK